MGPGSTRHTCTPAKINKLYLSPLHGPSLPPTIIVESMCNFIGKYCPMWGCLPFSSLLYHTPPHTPLITQNTPNSPSSPISVAPFLVSTHFSLCRVTFSIRPDEAASVWRQQKLVSNKLIYCFVSASRRYHIIDLHLV